MVLQIFTTLLEMVQLGRKTENEKDLEILLLRRQMAIYERVRHEAVWIIVQEVLRQTFNEPAVPSAVL
jgi:hypothetical protein